MFYSSYYHFDENKLYIFDDKKGIVKYNYSPYCYIKTDEETEYRTIFGDKVKQVRATKEYKTSPNAFEVDVSPTLRYLVDNYYNDDSIVQNRIMIIDIETETVGDIETTVRGENTILSIATYIDGNYSTFILDPEKRFINPKNGRNYYCFDDEKEMLKRFVLYLRKTAKPTIITGWNSYKFDTPTIYNRLKVLFGEKVANKLSPIGLVIDKTIGLNHRNEFYEGKSIIGINHLDYIILYKKYSQGDRSSYSLDNICKEELGEGKIEFKGNLNDLYKNDINKFVEYNENDVELLVKLENKLKYLKVAIYLCHKACITYEDIFAQSRIIEGLIFRYLKKNDLVSPNKSYTNSNGEKFRGAFVKEIIPKFYEWVIVGDFVSLYPSLIRTLNISPETKLGYIEDYEREAESFTFYIKGKKYTLKKEQFYKFIKEKKVIISSIGVLYNGVKKGIITQIVEDLFNDRLRFKKEMKIAKSENNLVLSEQKDIEQYVTKILLNSFFGVIGMNSFRFFDKDNAESITQTGQEAIKFTMQKANDYLNKKYNTNNEYVIGGDTDSLMFSVSDVTTDITEVNDIAKDITEYLNDSMKVFVKEELNSENCHLVIDQEVIAETVLWVAKKRYAMKVVVEEGLILKENKWKIKGLDIKKSDFPKSFKEILQEIIYGILNKKKHSEMTDLLIDFKKKIDTVDILDIAIPKGVHGISKYSNGVGGYTKGTPFHVKASYNYNNFLKRFKIDDYKSIRDGDKIKIIILKKNEFGFDTMAFKEDIMPEEMEKFILKYIDRDAIFNSVLKNKLVDIWNLMDWGNLQLTVQKNVFEDYY